VIGEVLRLLLTLLLLSEDREVGAAFLVEDSRGPTADVERVAESGRGEYEDLEFGVFRDLGFPEVPGCLFIDGGLRLTRVAEAVDGRGAYGAMTGPGRGFGVVGKSRALLLPLTSDLGPNGEE